MKAHRLPICLVVGAMLALSACASGSPLGESSAPPTSASPSPTVTATPLTAWSSDPVSVVRDIAVPPVPVCIAIRSAGHPEAGYDRIVFDFAGPLPGYDVRYVDKVVGDASGEEIAMPGRRYLQIVFRPAQGHDNQGTSVSGRTDLNYPMLKGYVVAGDFEAVFTVALGLDDTIGFRVGELPGRIYLDVAA